MGLIRGIAKDNLLDVRMQGQSELISRINDQQNVIILRQGFPDSYFFEGKNYKVRDPQNPTDEDLEKLTYLVFLFSKMKVIDMKSSLGGQLQEFVAFMKGLFYQRIKLLRSSRQTNAGKLDFLLALEERFRSSTKYWYN